MLEPLLQAFVSNYEVVFLNPSGPKNSIIVIERKCATIKQVVVTVTNPTLANRGVDNEKVAELLIVKQILKDEDGRILKSRILH